MPTLKTSQDLIDLMMSELGTKIISDAKKEILNTLYPINSIYISANPTNPSKIIGGTWKQLSDGFLYAVSNSSVIRGDSGNIGSGTATNGHVLSIRQMPSHNHKQYFYIANSLPGGVDGFLVYGNINGNRRQFGNYMSESLGNNEAHSHNIPWVGVIVWQRTA